MREIKFRAWDKEGNNYSSWKPQMIYPETWAAQVETPGSSLYPHKSNRFEFLQFTGLKDKNGKEIYEGDWCSAMFRTKEGFQVIQGHIIFDEYMWCIDCTGCVGNDIFSINRPHDFEVIGNIYENPDLLNNSVSVANTLI